MGMGGRRNDRNAQYIPLAYLERFDQSLGVQCRQRESIRVVLFAISLNIGKLNNKRERGWGRNQNTGWMGDGNGKQRELGCMYACSHTNEVEMGDKAHSCQFPIFFSISLFSFSHFPLLFFFSFPPSLIPPLFPFLFQK